MLLLLASSIVAAFLTAGPTAEPTATAPALKAAFIYNFAKFAEWPPDVAPTGPLNVCVVGDPAVADALEVTAKGHSIDGREVVVSRPLVESPLRGCHLLYVGRIDARQAAHLVDDLKSAPVLTIGDRDDFPQWNGIIGLFVENGRMRFAVNVDAVSRAGFRLSSRLLSLAKILKDRDVRN